MGHAVAIVDHANHALAASFDLDADGLRAGVERILEQLLHDGRGPLDDFASRDAVGNSFRQDADSAHLASANLNRGLGVGPLIPTLVEPRVMGFSPLGIGSHSNWPLAELKGHSSGRSTSFAT